MEIGNHIEGEGKGKIINSVKSLAAWCPSVPLYTACDWIDDKSNDGRLQKTNGTVSCSVLVGGAAVEDLMGSGCSNIPR